MSAPARSVCAALFVLALLVATASAEAPADNPGDTAPAWAYDLPNDLMSPFCPGRSLADCPSPDAASLRMWILVQAAAGRTRADVEGELFERYGEVIRSAPKAEGIGAAAYWMPAAVFAAGGALVVWFLRRATRRGAASEPPLRPLDPDVERKLDELLGREGDDREEDR
jgi:cytochrome c-type biogenesis protein CcmH/NrfF